MTPPLQKPRQGLPADAELSEVFSRVVGSWAKLSPSVAEGFFHAPRGGALERKVIFSGPLPFLMVMRTTREFGILMGKLLFPDADVQADPEDAFTELVNVYCGHLKGAVWGEDAPYSVHIPEKSIYKEWPSYDAVTACYLRVGAFPVEILIWELPPKTQ